MARGLHEPNSLHRVHFFYPFLARVLCYCSFLSVVFCFVLMLSLELQICQLLPQECMSKIFFYSKSVCLKIDSA